MACMQGTWWGVGGGVAGGWWGSWFWCQVSGWGWVLGLGCLVGGGVRLVGPGSRLGGWRGARGAAPLRPLLNSRPRLLGGLWFLVRVVPLLGGGVRWLVGFCGVQFFSDGVGWSCGWLVLLVVSWLGCSQPGVVVAVLVGRLGSVACLLGLFPGCWLRGLCSMSGGCSQACRVVPVGRADLDGRALRRPPLSPPTVHDGPS